MVTVEELRAAWPVREIPFHGTCIVVPANRFSKFWEDDLKSQGVVVLYQMLPGGPCALVRLKDKLLESSGPKIVFEPKKETSVSMTHQRWSDDEDKKLMRRMGELHGSVSHRCSVLAKEFGRGSSSLQLRFYKLKPHGVTEENLPTQLPTALANGLHEILVEIQDEVLAMVKEHGDFKSCHEGYAVILEVLEMLWDEVKRPAEDRDLQTLRGKALCVAASAAKFALFVEKKGLESSS